MTKKLGDYSTATALRDIITNIATNVVESLRPRQQYAEVQAWDRNKRTCTVRFPGEEVDVIVPMGAIQPTRKHQIVRIVGTRDDRYVAEVMGSATLVGNFNQQEVVFTTAGTSSGTQSDQIAVFNRTGTLSVITGVTRFRFPFAVTLLGVSGSVATAPVGSTLIFDVNRNGTTIFSGTKPTIQQNSNSVDEVVPSVTSIVAGEYLTVDIDQVGSSTPGSDLTVFIRYRKT